MRELSGVLPVIQTPFLDDGAIDESELVRELHWVLDQGVAGLTTGMVSEVLRLTEVERQRLNEIVIGVARERGALSVVSCGAESTRGAVAYARSAQRAGADAVMAIAPVTVVLGDDELYAYYSAIADAIEIGLVVQDASGYVGRPLSIAVQVQLLARYGRRVYFKPEAPPIGQRVSLLRDATDGLARVFEGTGGIALVDTFRRGVVGTMPGAEMCWAIQALWEALTNGDWARAYDILGPICSLVDLQNSLDAYVAVEKHILQSQGVLASTLARGPLGYVLDRETRDEVDRLMQRLGEVVAGPTVG
ncbi:MAG: dihydrodipicolinate synthase family protein [Acidimicrobiales bacterium]